MHMCVAASMGMTPCEKLYGIIWEAVMHELWCYVELSVMNGLCCLLLFMCLM